MNGKTEGTSVVCHHTWMPCKGSEYCLKCGGNRSIETAQFSGPSLDTRAICDKLDFLGRVVVAAIVYSSTKKVVDGQVTRDIAPEDATTITNELFDLTKL